MHKSPKTISRGRTSIPICICSLIALLLLPGCSDRAAFIGIIGGADGPTAIFVTGGGEEPQRTPYAPVLSPMAEEDGWLSFADLMEEELPYIALGTEIRLPGENLTVADYLLKKDGRVRYNDGKGGPLSQAIELEHDEEGLFFLLPGNFATALSSHTADYAPGAAIRGFAVTDEAGNASGFVIRTDPGFLIEESGTESVGIIGGADGPSSIHIKSKYKASEIEIIPETNLPVPAS